jgi:hypothetical protein
LPDGTGKRAAYVVRHAHILLGVDESESGKKMSNEQAARAYGVSVRSVEHVRQRLVEEGLEAALGRKEAVPAQRREDL